jgi:hypothetical protein
MTRWWRKTDSNPRSPVRQRRGRWHGDAVIVRIGEEPAQPRTLLGGSQAAAGLSVVVWRLGSGRVVTFSRSTRCTIAPRCAGISCRSQGSAASASRMSRSGADGAAAGHRAHRVSPGRRPDPNSDAEFSRSLSGTAATSGTLRDGDVRASAAKALNEIWPASGGCSSE